jgi:ABC-type nitrate/sulfonate/bicarbonate transport system substrate-binding protein
VSWQLVAGSGITRLKDLKGKKVVVPSIGAKEQAFVTNALLDGEVDASYFDKILEASDPSGAVSMVVAGKADAAFVPSGTSLSGLSKVMGLGQVGLPMFVSLPGNEEALVKKFSSRVKSHSGGGFGFTSADAGKYRSLSGSFGKSTKKGPMAVPPPARLTVRDILEGRKFSIPTSDVLTLVEAPKPMAPKTAPAAKGKSAEAPVRPKKPKTKRGGGAGATRGAK